MAIPNHTNTRKRNKLESLGSIYSQHSFHRRRRGGEHRERPSRLKTLLEENDVISEGYIFSNNFSKNSSKLKFSIEFLSKMFRIF